MDSSHSDIDLMLVSDSLTFGDTYLAFEAASKSLGRDVNPTILTAQDFAKRRQARRRRCLRVPCVLTQTVNRANGKKANLHKRLLGSDSGQLPNPGSILVRCIGRLLQRPHLGVPPLRRQQLRM